LEFIASLQIGHERVVQRKRGREIRNVTAFVTESAAAAVFAGILSESLRLRRGIIRRNEDKGRGSAVSH
jgi:hypothetical protein